MVSDVWHWFLIALIGASVGVGVVCFVIILYVIIAYWSIERFFTDKFTNAKSIASQLASYSFSRLGQ